MPSGLTRYYGGHDLHFITFSCYHRQPFLNTVTSRDMFVETLEETRQRYSFLILGYVFMSNHIHLLITEPEKTPLSTTIQVLKQRFSRTRLEQFVWEPRYHDFNVFTESKKIEKLPYMHPIPSKPLIKEPHQWPWCRAYADNEPHPIQITTDYR